MTVRCCVFTALKVPKISSADTLFNGGTCADNDSFKNLVVIHFLRVAPGIAIRVECIWVSLCRLTVILHLQKRDVI